MSGLGAAGRDRTAGRTGDEAAYSAARILVSGGAAFGVAAVIWFADVLLAYSDRRALVRLGVPAPFAASWAIFSSVYLIGRGVVLRRQVGRGMTLTWVGIGIAALNLICSFSGAYDRLIGAILA